MMLYIIAIIAIKKSSPMKANFTLLLKQDLFYN